ncbi:MAG: PspC domain-containing protein [Bacteroidota bacterium]
MKRTITMNLSGIIFHIEEDAYEKLNNYLATIKSYFKNSEGCDEIMHDIESRIAEMLQGKVNANKQAVIRADVESVITVMGKPEEFAGEGAKEDTNSNNQAKAESTGSFSGRRRRVFRDPDEKILGGVCSGIANYFDLDPLWLRAAFVISFFAFGASLLIYIILCIIIPKAKTTAEKLEMRGEKVDVNNIGKAVNEEFQDFKKRMKDFGDDVQSPENKARIKSSAQKLADLIKQLLFNVFRIFGKVFAFLLIFFGVVLTIALLATLFGRGTISIFDSPGSKIHFSLYELSSAVFPSDLPTHYLVIGLMLFVGIPLLSMIYGGIKYLFGFKQKNRVVKYAANILWLCGLGLIIYVGIQLGADFSEQATTKQNIDLVQPKEKVLFLDLKPMPVEEEEEITYHHHRNVHFGDWTMISKDDNKFRLGYPTLNIVASATDSFELVAIKTANGFDKKEAAYRAKNIRYSIAQTDSLLEFNSYFDIDGSDKLRAQEVRLVLKVPVNKVVFLSKRMENILFDIDNINETLDSDMVNRKWVMTKQGLECVDCEGLEDTDKKAEVAPPTAPPAPPRGKY